MEFLREQIVVRLGVVWTWASCPWCRSRISVEGIQYGTATDAERQFVKQPAAAEAEQRGVDGAQYWGGTPPPELTVGYLTDGCRRLMGVRLPCAKFIARLRKNCRITVFQFDLGFCVSGSCCRRRRPARDDCACRRAIG